jgi:hypothetical protein
MQRRIIGVSGALALAAALVACRSMVSVSQGESLPPALLAGAAALSDEEIRLARTVYVAKCAKCHRFYHPAHYSETDWATWMKKMSRKSKLKPDQEDLLSRFLGAFRFVDPPDKTRSR